MRNVGSGGAIEGSTHLRELIAQTYEHQALENVVVTHGAIGANALVHQTLVEPGDRVISVLPTYQQHYSIPESYGADVQILRLRAENGFLPDLNELRTLATPGTKWSDRLRAWMASLGTRHARGSVWLQARASIRPARPDRGDGSELDRHAAARLLDCLRLGRCENFCR